MTSLRPLHHPAYQRWYQQIAQPHALHAQLQQAWTRTTPEPLARLAGRVAVRSGADDPDLVALCSLALWAAADLLDDLADGHASCTWRMGSLDVTRLLALATTTGALIPGGTEVIATAMLKMSDGQQRDLQTHAGTAQCDSVQIAELKAGAEVAAMFELAALSAGLDPKPHRTVGQALGTLLQIGSDVHDLFTGESSEDWTLAKPTLPMQLCMDERLRQLLAGDAASTVHEARDRMAWNSAARSRVLATLDEQLGIVRSHATPALGIAVELAEATRGVVSSLWTVQRTTQRPTLGVGDLRRAARAFVEASPDLAEAVTVHRWGLFGQAVVRADVFGRLLVLEATHHSSGDRIIAALHDRARTSGWRYLADRPELPEDSDDLGLAMQLLGARTTAAEVDRLRGAFAPEGWVNTWITSPDDRVPDGVEWEPRPCPVVTLNAWSGLTAAGSGPPDVPATEAWLRTWHPAQTPHYPAVLAASWVLRHLASLDRLPALRERLADWLLYHQHPTKGWGDALSTSAAARALKSVGRPVDAIALARTLLQWQAVDGGFPACPTFVTFTAGPSGVPGPGWRWWSSRLVTTAWVIGALADAKDAPLTSPIASFEAPGAAGTEP